MVDNKHQLISWGVVMVLFLVMAVVCIGMIMTPVKTIYNEHVTAPSSITYQGLRLKVETWKEYPRYNIGFGVLAGLGFIGAIYACSMMYAIKEVKNDAL